MMFHRSWNLQNQLAKMPKVKALNSMINLEVTKRAALQAKKSAQIDDVGSSQHPKWMYSLAFLHIQKMLIAIGCHPLGAREMVFMDAF
jgi:hypothetical protein